MRTQRRGAGSPALPTVSNHRARVAPTETSEALAFISHAIVRHAGVRRRDGLPVPAMALAVARWCADQARNGEDRQPLDVGDVARDVGIMDDQLLLTGKDTGILLRCSERTVRSLITRGLLPAIKVGGATRIKRSDLDAFIAARPPAARFRDDVEVKDDADATSGATRIRRSDLGVCVAGRPSTARFRDDAEVKDADATGGPT